MNNVAMMSCYCPVGLSIHSETVNTNSFGGQFFYTTVQNTLHSDVIYLFGPTGFFTMLTIRAKI